MSRNPLEADEHDENVEVINFGDAVIVRPKSQTPLAKSLRSSLEITRNNQIKAACMKTDFARKATTDEERIRWLKAARDDINGALVAMGEERE